MALHWRPVGPRPTKVYWRRRAAVLGVVLLLLLLVLTQCGAEEDPTPVAQQSADLAGSAPAAAELPEPVATSPVPQPSVDDVPGCPDAQLALDADAAPPRMAAGDWTQLRLSVTNEAESACRRELGQGAIEVSVFSGDDRIWSSDDCAPGGAEGPVVLQAGEQRLLAVRWDGRRSRPGCEGDAQRAEPGAYRVVARVGTLTEEGQRLTVE